MREVLEEPAARAHVVLDEPEEALLHEPDLPGARWRPEVMLRERDWGEYDLKSQQERRGAFEEYEARRRRESLFWAPPGGESLAQVAQRVDAMMDQTKDMMTGRMAHKYRERFGFGSLDDKAVAEVEAAWFASTLPRHLAFFEKALAESGSGWLVGSRTPTAADFLVGCQLRAFEKTCADKVTMPAALADAPRCDGIFSAHQCVARGGGARAC